MFSWNNFFFWSSSFLVHFILFHSYNHSNVCQYFSSNGIDQFIIITVFPTKKVWADLLEAETIVRTSLVKFIHERLVNQPTGFPHPMERKRLTRFPSMIKKSVKIKSSGKIASYCSKWHLWKDRTYSAKKRIEP